MIKSLNHVSLVVPDLDSALCYLRDAFGLQAGPVMVNEQQGVLLSYVDLGNARIEIVQPRPENSALIRFLERHPQGGLHHLSLQVESVSNTCQQLASLGIKPVGAAGALNVHGDLIAFIHPRDFLGALLELEESRG